MPATTRTSEEPVGDEPLEEAAPGSGDAEERNDDQHEEPTVEERLAKLEEENATLRRQHEQSLAEKQTLEETKAENDRLRAQIESGTRPAQPAGDPDDDPQLAQSVQELEYRAASGDAVARVSLANHRRSIKQGRQTRDVAMFADIPVDDREATAQLYYGTGRFGDPHAAYEALLGRRAAQASRTKETPKPGAKPPIRTPAERTEEPARPVSTVTRTAPRVQIRNKTITRAELQRLAQEADQAGSDDVKKRQDVLKITRDLEEGRLTFAD
jgi:hypothetical protein